MNELIPNMYEHDPLATLETKFNLVRDYVGGVCRGYKTGFFLYGSGGVGKSFTVLRHLEYLQAPYRLYNSRMTAKGLFLQLQEAPDLTHVLEDMERLTNDAHAQGVLRSALWAPLGHPRVITWTTAAEGTQRVEFRGGLILISNRPLKALPELEALATRIEVHKLSVTDAELTALMRHLASQGYCDQGKVVIQPEECREVTEYLLAECRQAGCPLDLRLQQKSLRTYLQWEADLTSLHWKDLIAASVREVTHHFRYESNTQCQEAKRAEKRNFIRELLTQEPDVREQERLYRAKTGASRADFFRRKREVESGDFDAQDAAS